MKRACLPLAACLLGLPSLSTVSLWSAEDAPPKMHQDLLFAAEGGVIGLRVTPLCAGRDAHAEWEALLDHLLKQGDADGDGVTTWDELKPVLPTPAQLQMLLTGSRIDESLNTSEAAAPAGPVDREQLRARLAELGLQPIQFRYSASVGMDAVGGPGVPLYAGTILFSRLDRDRNGRLSPDELQAGLETLQYLDENEDDLLTVAELDATARSQVQASPLGMTNSAMDTGPFLLVPPGPRLEAGVRMLLRRYDTPSERDGRLSAIELGLSTAEMQPFDTNDNGGLDRAELAQWLSQPRMGYRVTADIGNAGLAPSLQVTVDEAMLPVSQDGPARVTATLPRLSLSLIAAGAGPPFDPQSLAAQWLQRMDRDANGYLDEAELRNFAAQPLLVMLDADRNGQVPLAELKSFADTRLRLLATRIVITATDSGRNLFESLDTNHDLRLSVAEFRNGSQQIAVWDHNGDGELSDLEVPQRMALTITREAGPAFLQRAGLVTAAAASPLAPQSPAGASGAPAWFTAMDRNSDGEISRHEFLGPLARFQQLDANGDGRLEASETRAK